MRLRASTYRAVDAGRWFFREPQVLRIRPRLQASQWWTPEQIQDLQNESVCALIEYVYAHVPYYRNIMKELGLKPRDIRTTDDLIKLPILDKDTFRNNWDKLISDQVDPAKIRMRDTRGTTGEPLGVARDPLSGVYENAAARRGLGFSGYRPGDKLIKLFGGTLGLTPETRLDKLKVGLRGEVFLPAFELSRQNVEDYFRVIQHSKAKFLRGYTSAVYLLSKLMKESGLHLRLQAVFPTAETLYDHQRELIAERLGPVFEYYGCGELNSIAFECESHYGLHISEEHVFLDVLRDGERIPEGEMGAVTVTTLENYTMPLIRYQNGDVRAYFRTLLLW